MTIVWVGLATGALYAIIAVAYNVVLIGTGSLNFAQAAFVVFGTFVGYVAIEDLGFHFILAVLLAVVIGGLLGIIEEFTAIRLIPKTGGHTELVTTLGFAVVIEGVLFVMFGPQPLPVGYFMSNEPISVLGGRAYPAELVMIGLAVVVALGLEFASRRTNIGIAALATAEDRDAARARGIDVRALGVGAFALAGALSVAAGPFVAPSTLAVYSLGNAFALKGFVALAIGGFGSNKGALVGGLAVGLVQAHVGRYLGVEYQNLVLFVILLAVLLVKPNGLFGRRLERAV